MQALSNEQIMRASPSVFATEPWSDVSDKYSFVPTINVVDCLRNEGFFPVKAMESKTRTPGKKGYSKHMLRFRQSQYLDNSKVGEEVPEIVLVNSHDRTSGFALSAGVFRLVCSNGMIVKSSNFGDISVRHSGSDIEGQVVEGSLRIIEDMPAIINSMNEMKAIQLSSNEQLAYATAALELRYPSDDAGNSTSPIAASKLLQVKRYADNKNDLWTSFNRVQENFMKGGLRGINSIGQHTTLRKISSVSEDVRLNKALWMLTESMAKLHV